MFHFDWLFQERKIEKIDSHVKTLQTLHSMKKFHFLLSRSTKLHTFVSVELYVCSFFQEKYSSHLNLDQSWKKSKVWQMQKRRWMLIEKAKVHEMKKRHKRNQIERWKFERRKNEKIIHFFKYWLKINSIWKKNFKIFFFIA